MAKKPSKPGNRRPKRHPIDARFTRLWFRAVALGLGLPTPGKVERYIQPGRVTRKNGRQVRSSRWYSYKVGRRVPTLRNGVHPVDLAEQACRGTARYFQSPLKTLLRGDTVSREWIDEQLLALPAQLVELLVLPPPEACSSLPVAFLQPFDDLRARQLALVGGLHALEAAVLLMKLGEVTASPELRRLAREAYIRTQPSVRKEPVLSTMADELFACIDNVFPRWLYLRPDLRLEVMSLSFFCKESGLLTPDEVLAEEDLPHTITMLVRIAAERRVLEARLRAAQHEAAA